MQAFNGFGFGHDGFHMSFGIGAFPFGLFASVFNVSDGRPPARMYHVVFSFTRSSLIDQPFVITVCSFQFFTFCLCKLFFLLRPSQSLQSLILVIIFTVSV